MEEQIKLPVAKGVLRILQGKISTELWIVLLLVSLAAIGLSMYAHYRNKGRKNIFTPSNFSWKFLIFDNCLRIVAGLVVMYFIFRLSSIFVSAELLNNEDGYMIFALAVGFFMSYGVDKAIQKLQEKTNVLSMPKEVVQAEAARQIVEQIKEENTTT